MDKNKSLIEYKKESIVSRVINFFKSIFQKNKINTIENNNNNIIDNKTDVISSSNKLNVEKELEVKSVEIEDRSIESDKAEFFKIYNDFKERKIAINELSFYDVIRITKMFNEENNMYIKAKEKKYIKKKRQIIICRFFF